MLDRSSAASRPNGKKRARGRPVGQAPTRENILRAAISVFATNGYAGARVDAISKAARTTDRMIYYYFGSKNALFVAALETVYQELGDAESALDLSGLSAQDSLRAIIRFTWNHYLSHPELLTLLNNENLLKGRHVTRSKRVKELSFPLLSILADVYSRGVREGAFRPNVEVRDLYIVICSLGYFYLSNCYTLSAFLGTNLRAPAALTNWKETMESVILGYLSSR
jgi:AcrR family transcriptional regulator